ncbi:MAG: hypothetical protein P4L49_19245 [Desulfosporosinus sp.]|nr:hypothetical protein [Desulfosporosinus sp.]
MLPKEKLQEELKQLTQSMTVEQLEKAMIYLKSLLSQSWDEYLGNIPYADEPWTEEDEIAVREAKEDIEKGEVYSLEEVMRKLGDL